MLYAVIASIVLLALLVAAVVYYRGKLAALLSDAASQEAGLERKERTAAEDQRNAGLESEWAAGEKAAGENKDAQEAIRRWRAVTDGLHTKDRR